MIKGIHHISMKCYTAEELRRVKDFYTGALGLSICREWDDGIMIDTGNGLIEIFTNGSGERTKGAIRHLALQTDDVDQAVEAVRNAGFEVLKEPCDKVIDSSPPYSFRMAFCVGPLGEEIEFFTEKQ